MMFAQFAHLGRVLAARDDLSPRDLICQGLQHPYNRLTEIRFDAQGNYLGAETRDLSTREGSCLPLIEVHSSTPAFITPLCKFSANIPNMLKRTRNCLGSLAVFAAEHSDNDAAELLEVLRKAMEEHEETIVANLQEQQEQFGDAEHRLALCPVVEGSSLPESICEWPLLDGWVVASLGDMYGEYSNADLTAEDRICSLCGDRQELVYGNFSKLKTYILDQPGRIAGGFTFSEAARNFPVCPSCAINASYGIDVILRDLSFSMFGINYLIVPDTAEDEILLEFYDNAVRWRSQRASLKEERLQRITRDEEEILDLIGEEFGDTTNLWLTLVFYSDETGSAQWRILAEVPEVLPSWLARVYEAKRKVEAELPEERNVAVTLGVVLYATRQAQGTSNKKGERLFLQWTEAILHGGALDRRAVMRIIVDYILRQYREDTRRGEGQSPRGGFAALQGYLLVRLLEELTIIDGAGGGQMESLGSFDNKWSQYLQERADFFGRPESRVAFLTGALIRQVAWVQQSKRNLKRTEDAPIFKKMRGMRLDASRLQSLLSEAKEKLVIYDADFKYRELQELLSSEWTQVGDGWSLSTDETTFYFTLGLNLSWHINRPDEEQSKEGEAQ
jgi:CRISPR-associated protein Csh1